jgi:hypothetical protein
LFSASAALAASLGTVLALMSVGCAEERDPINQVQANALDKSFFVGADLVSPADDPEFWTQTTIIDVGYGAGQFGLFNSTFTQEVARIKWQITEDLLIARLTYELVDDSDGKGVGPASTDGQVVAAYAIQSHFDIRRAYNPSTGEELNVIVENTTDRVWNQRQYFRVDWSRNLNTDAYDFDTLSLLGLFGGVSYEPLAYYVNDPSDEHAPYFSPDEGYFDVTNKVFATPGLIDLSKFGWGIDAFPACFLDPDFLSGTYPEGNCNPVELTLRQSFRRVVDTDYEPSHWDGYRFQAYGAFYNDRKGYARNYGMSDDKWYRFISRYNIWERSHFYGKSCKAGDVACQAEHAARLSDPAECYAPRSCDAAEPEKFATEPTDPAQKAAWLEERRVWTAQHCVGTPYGADPHRDLDGNGTEDECEIVQLKTGYPGSKCDTFKQRCTLPYRLRKQKPLVWYYTNGSHPDYFEGTAWAAHDHDVAMRHAIMAARYAECMATTLGDAATKRAYCLTGENPATKTRDQSPNPVYFGQMDDHLEAQLLAQEVDDCRHGKSNPAFGPVNSPQREQACVKLADTIAEKRKAGGATIDDAVVALAKMPEQIILCHSPVEADDPAGCAPAEERLPAGVSAADCAAARKSHDASLLGICASARNVRRGDLRYHLVNVMAAPQTPSPWGIYSDATDPLTGEDFSASINVWSHVNDLWSQLVVDRIRYIKGELTTEQVTEAKYVQDWVKAAEAAGGNGMAPKLTRADVDRRVAEAAQTNAETVRQFFKSIPADHVQAVRQLRAEATGVMAAADAPSHMAPLYEARRAMGVGSELEAELTDVMMQERAGVEKLGGGEAALEFASPLRGQFPLIAKQLRHMKEMALGDRHACILHEAPAPMAVTGLADALERKFSNVCARQDGNGTCTQRYGGFGTNGLTCSKGGDGNDVCVPKDSGPDLGWQAERAEAMRKYLAQKAHYAVIAHEMGHSVALRHNFVSSSDAYNYRPQYWQLRTDDGRIQRYCGCKDGEDAFNPMDQSQPSGYCLSYEGTDAGGENECVGPRYFDPMGKNERDNLLWAWMQSTVMDYAGEYTQDLLGLGGYDFAAHRMFYGETTAVFDSFDYQSTKPHSYGMLYKMDSFGGILGFQPQFDGRDVHYSGYQNNYNLISDCKPVDEKTYLPEGWDERTMGTWDPVIDGLIVANRQGQFTKCRQQKVDYVPWSKLRFPVNHKDPSMSPEIPTAKVGYYRGGPSIDTMTNRIRVPYGFATDRWADLGNASVYRHDNGADVYEIFDFLLTQGEVQHIFDSYRRGRHSFSVRNASNRTLTRYHEKIRDGAKGLGLLANIYRDFALERGFAFEGGYWGFIGRLAFPDNVLAAGLVFDHFTRSFARPQVGAHYRDGAGVLRSNDDDSYASNVFTEVNIPNGATGYWETVTAGGKLVENQLCEDCGEYDSEFTMNAGSYYDKVYVPYLMAESVDNFISDSRNDFVDGRYRAVSLADVFGDGYRRWLANNLTGDDFLKGPRLAVGANGSVVVDEKLFPSWPIGWTTWWTEQPEVCFPAEGTTLCNALGFAPEQFAPRTPDSTVPIDPQVGWEQQKWLIYSTMVFLPENQKQYWVDQLRLYQLGLDSDPEFDNRIELHDPYGRVYVAKSLGKETIFGKPVERGIGARVLEYANELLAAAYVTTDGPDKDGDGKPDWFVPVIDPKSGKALVKYDPSMKFVDSTGALVGQIPGCGPQEQTSCPCSANRACVRLEKYVTVPFFLWEATVLFGHAKPKKKGVYD